jgi:hypothetical protein
MKEFSKVGQKGVVTVPGSLSTIPVLMVFNLPVLQFIGILSVNTRIMKRIGSNKLKMAFTVDVRNDQFCFMSGRDK